MTTTSSTLFPVEYYTEFDQYYYTVDNRPLYTLAIRDIQLAQAIDSLSNTTSTPGRLLRVLVYTTNGVYLKSPDCNKIEVELWGAGGGITDGSPTLFNSLNAGGGSLSGVGGTSTGGTINQPGGNGGGYSSVTGGLAIGGSSTKGGSGGMCSTIGGNSYGVFPGGGGANLSVSSEVNVGGGGGYCYWFGNAPTNEFVTIGTPGTYGASGFCIIKEYS